MKAKEIKTALWISLLTASAAVIAGMFTFSGGASIGLFYILFAAGFLCVNILLFLAVGRFRKRRAAGIIAYVLIGVLNFAAAFGVSVYYLQEKLLFYPNNSVQCFEALQTNTQFQEVSVTARDGTLLKGWVRFNTDRQSAPLLLYFGGNGQNSSKAFYNFLNQGIFSAFADCNVMMMDYRGYGYSGGNPSDTILFSDALDIYNYAIKQPYVNKAQVIPMGYSMGTGVATYLASQRQVAGLVLVAPYYDGRNLCNGMLDIFHGPLSLLVRYKFDSESFAPEVKAKPLILTSKTDDMISFRQSEELAEKFQSVYSFVYITGTDHNHYFDQSRTLDEIKSYLDWIVGGANE